MRHFMGPRVHHGMPGIALWIDDEASFQPKLFPLSHRRIDRGCTKVRQSKANDSQVQTCRIFLIDFATNTIIGRRSCYGCSIVTSEEREYLPVGLIDRQGGHSHKSRSHFTTLHSGTWLSSPRACIRSGSARSARMRNRFLTTPTPWLEHLPRPHADRTEQGRPDPLRRGHPAGPRGAFPRHHRRPLRPRDHARQTSAPPMSERRSAGTHLHRAAVQERHRTAGKAVRTLHQDDGRCRKWEEVDGATMKNQFKRRTMVAAAREVISHFKSQIDMEILKVQWGVN